MSANCQRLWARMMVAGWVALAACPLCRGADSYQDNLGVMGLYAAQNAAPDNMTATDTAGRSLQVTGGMASPLCPFDQGSVRLTSMSGATAVFCGRSTGWGCGYTTWGVFVATGSGGGAGQPPNWNKSFQDDGTPRIVLEINGPGSGDDVVLLGNNGATLSVWIFGATRRLFGCPLRQ